MKYRAEVDGLRALAVVPVILFHAGFELFSGGFVGVDVFFVISGYLITTILIEDIENNRFSIVNFYERRARRILPALFFVMLVCIPFAWMWMLPSQMKDFSQSLVAVSLFASNILFWRESGYFAATAEEKPLLHTWSLAVEEQYYVLFPIFLILAWRFGKNRVFWMIVVMAAVSLLLSEWGWRNKATANFYLALTRAWELFAGSIAAFIVQKQGVQKNNLLALIGLAAIVFSIFFYDETTPFPSAYALVPVLGVVLLVLYADKETITARLLRTKGFVGIGLISYSAYLWHQPLFAFAKIKLSSEPADLITILLSLSSFLIGYLSWKFLEQPFRSRAFISSRNVLLCAFAGMSFFIFIGIVGHYSNGFLLLLTEHQQENEASLSKMQNIRYHNMRSGVCHFNGNDDEFSQFILNWEKRCVPNDNLGKTIALFGDSHAADKASAFLLNGLDFTQLGKGGCNLMNSNDHNALCNILINKFITHLKERKNYDLLILSNQFKGDELSHDYLQKMVNFWSPFAEKVLIFSPMPEFPKIELDYISGGVGAISKMKGDFSKHQSFFSSLKNVSLPSNTRILNTAEIFCRISSNACEPVVENKPLLVDYGHLSAYGAAKFGQLSIQMIAQ